MKKQRIIELAVKVIVAALTAFLTARSKNDPRWFESEPTGI